MINAPSLLEPSWTVNNEPVCVCVCLCAFVCVLCVWGKSGSSLWPATPHSMIWQTVSILVFKGLHNMEGIRESWFRRSIVPSVSSIVPIVDSNIPQQPSHHSLLSKYLFFLSLLPAIVRHMRGLVNLWLWRYTLSISVTYCTGANPRQTQSSGNGWFKW